MKKLRLFSTLMLAAAALFAVSCDKPEPDPEPKPEPPTPEPVELTFEVSIDEVTKSSVVYSVVPSDKEATYLSIVVPESMLDESGVGEKLATDILAELKNMAAGSGKTMDEYMPTITAKGDLSNITTDGLAAASDYSLVVFGLDEKWEATTLPNCTPFTTEEVEVVACTFEVIPTVEGTTATIQVTPSDKSVKYHLFIVEYAMFDAYTNPEGQYKMSVGDFYAAYLDSELQNYLAQGYPMDMLWDGLFYSGDVKLQAKNLNANTDYVYMVATGAYEDGQIYVTSEPTYDTFTSGDVATSDLTFEIQLSNPETNRFDLMIIPSNLDEPFTWIQGPYDGVSTDQELADAFIAQNKSWLDMGFMTYKGVQDYTAAGPNYKYKVDSPDTEYYVMAIGYAGGPTTAPTVAKIRTLPAPKPEDATFQLTAHSATAYGFKVDVDSSDQSTAYVFGTCEDGTFNEAEICETMVAEFQYLYEMMVAWDPTYTMAQVLGTYAWKGDYTIDSSATEPGKTYTAFILAFNQDGTVAKVHTYPSIVTTPEVGSVTPTLELVGYYSGDEENGALFGQPDATAGMAITVVKFGNLDAASYLYHSTSYDTTIPTLSDAEIYNGLYWSQQSISTPYGFYVMDWTYTQYVVSYALDASSQPGGVARLEVTPTAENKSPYSELEALVKELNSKSNVFSPSKENIRVERAGTILNKKTTNSVFNGTLENAEVELPATISRPAEAKAMDLTSLRALKAMSAVRTR